MDLDSYRAGAEAFLAALNAAYHRHFAGLDADFPLEDVYAAHAGLFTRAAVDGLRTAHPPAPPALLEFAVAGHLERATAGPDAERGRREATLRVEVDGERLGFREAARHQATEPDRGRRARIEAARLAATEEHVTPLAREALEISHAGSRALGWTSHRAMWAELRGLDLDALAAQARGFLTATAEAFPALVDPELRRTLGIGLDEWRRADLPYWLRVPEADALFPPGRLVPSLRDTAAGLGLALEDRPNIALDVESRPLKSPRAFCAPVRVPGDIRLVLPPVGGAEDYAVLFHEGGHALHYGSVDAGATFEARALGDSSVTESFAFLFEHITEEPGWLHAQLGVEDPGAYVAHQRARKLVYLRRYCAKLLYEDELHAADALAGFDAVYARRLADALRTDWPRATWLTDLDPGFYSASYLRAWAIEAGLRARLRADFGAGWWAEPAAGAELVGLMRRGQPHRAEELLGAEIDLGVLVADLGL